MGRGSLKALASLEGYHSIILTSPSVTMDEELVKSTVNYCQTIEKSVLIIPSGEPVLSELIPTLDSIMSIQPDWIVAIGGGSVIDAAKLLWVLYEQPNILDEKLTRPFSIGPMRKKARFVAVPTTPGTGSEVSSSAIFSFASGEQKNFL